MAPSQLPQDAIAAVKDVSNLDWVVAAWIISIYSENMLPMLS